MIRWFNIITKVLLVTSSDVDKNLYAHNMSFICSLGVAQKHIFLNIES